MKTRKIPQAIDKVYRDGLKAADWFEVAEEVITQIKDLSYNRVLAIATAVCPECVAEWPREELLSAIRDRIIDREYYQNR